MSALRQSLWISVLTLAATIWGGAAHAVDVDAMPTPELQARYDALTHELRCMQCQNQSIADSPVGLASDLRRDVREQLIAGKSDREIRDSMVARYGNVILFRPPFEATTAWVWVLPFLLLILGAFVAVRIVRQRAALVASDDSVVDADDSPR
jgi:cytochrome c-type biogenesis protein CcmH